MADKSEAKPSRGRPKKLSKKEKNRLKAQNARNFKHSKRIKTDQTSEEAALAVTNLDQSTYSLSEQRAVENSDSEILQREQGGTSEEATLAVKSLEQSLQVHDRLDCNSDAVIGLSFDKRNIGQEIGSSVSASFLDQKRCQSSPHNDSNEAVCVIASTNSLATIPDRTADGTCVMKDHSQATATESPSKAQTLRERAPDVTHVMKDHSQATAAESPSQLQNTDSAVQDTVINVYIKWADTETGATTLLVWDHQSCDVCCATLADWKHHVKKEHALHDSPMTKSESKPQQDGDLEESNTRSTAKRFQVPVIKSETPDIVTTKKRGRPRKEARQQVKVVVSKKRGRLSKESRQDTTMVGTKKRGRPKKDIAQDTTLVVPKKQGRPKKVIKQDDTVAVPIWTERNEGDPQLKIKLEKSYVHVDAELTPFERKADPPEVKVDKGNDSKYIPPGQQARLLALLKNATKKVRTCPREECRGMIFRKLQDLKDHQCDVHGNQFPCPICHKTYKSQKIVNIHVKFVHREKSFGCDRCPKAFKSQKVLDTHMRLHTGQGLLECRFCGKKLNSKHGLECHERSHSGEKPYKCDHCDRAFGTKGALRNHVQDHTGIQFVCAQCGHRVKTKSLLVVHERTHTGARPIECDQCGKTYRDHSGLRHHKQASHSDTPQFMCDICSKMFWTSSSLSVHKYVHSGEKNFKCDYCHKRFGSRGILLGHIKQVHLGQKRRGHGRGHRGEAKKSKEDTSARNSHQMVDNAKSNSVLNAGNEASTSADGITASQRVSEVRISEVRAASMLPPPMVPLNLDLERVRLAGVHHLPPGPIPTPYNPQPDGDPRSDFNSMVESFMHFSKEH